MVTLSVSMIVKNEERVLARCLESVKEADEIIIVDTGSTDRTREIATKYTDKYYEGTAYVTSIARTDGLEESSTFEATFEGTGELEKGTEA